MLLNQILHGAARRAPDSTGLFWNGQAYTFAELSDQVHRLAGALSRLTAPCDRVAVLADNSVEYLNLLYAAPEAGCVLAVVNQRLSAVEVEFVLTNAAPSVLVVGASYLEKAAGAIDALGVAHVVVIGETDRAGVLRFDDLLDGPSPDADRPHRSDDEVAWLIHTSGTTGKPKGVMLTHRNIVTAILNCLIEWAPEPGATGLFCFPMAHMAAFVPLLYHLRCSAVVLMSGFDSGEFLRLVERHRVQQTGLAPVMLSFLLAHPDIDTADLSSLRLIIYGASPMQPELLRRCIARFGHCFLGTYGMTELAGNVLQLGPEEHRRAAEGEPELLQSAGRMEALADVRVVDEEFNDVPVGTVGELIVAGDQVMKGYWRDQQTTADTIVDGWLRTGDLARQDAAGRFYIVDRKKDMIISGGENVYPREVEDVISGMPEVGEVAVIGLLDPTWGEMVTALVVPAPGTAVTVESIRAACGHRLAGFKLPKRVLLVDALPRNSSGKVLKRDLRAQIDLNQVTI